MFLGVMMALVGACQARFAQGQITQLQAADSVPAPTITVANAGASRHVPGRWSTLSVNGLNKTGKDVEEMGVVTVGENSNLQYGRRLWIPAGSKRQSWLSIEIPEEVVESVDPRQLASGIYTELTTM